MEYNMHIDTRINVTTTSQRQNIGGYMSYQVVMLLKHSNNLTSKLTFASHSSHHRRRHCDCAFSLLELRNFFQAGIKGVEATY